MCHEFSVGCLFYNRLLPLAVIIVGSCPTLVLEACIVMLAKIYLVGSDGALCTTPRRVGGDNLTGAVCVLNLYLSKESRCAITHCRPILHKVVESVAENSTYAVVALLDIWRKVVGEVHNDIFVKRVLYHDAACSKKWSLGVVGLIWGEVVVTYTLAIEI